MKKVNHFLPSSELKKQTGKNSEMNQSKASPNLLTEKHIAQLWAKMARVYGHRWVSGFGEADDGTWLDGLKGLLPEDLADGYRSMVDSREFAWPPTLPEFRSLCFGVDEGQAVEEAKLKIRKQTGSFDFNKLTTNQIEAKIKKILPSIISEREHEIAAENLVAGNNRIERDAT